MLSMQILGKENGNYSVNALRQKRTWLRMDRKEARGSPGLHQGLLAFQIKEMGFIPNEMESSLTFISKRSCWLLFVEYIE